MSRLDDIELELAGCDRSVFTPGEGERHRGLIDTVMAAATAVEAVPAGYRFVIPPDAVVPAAEWIMLERRCCPMFSFNLSWPTSGDPVLEVTGGASAQPLLGRLAGLAASARH